MHRSMSIKCGNTVSHGVLEFHYCSMYAGGISWTDQ